MKKFTPFALLFTSSFVFANTDLNVEVLESLKKTDGDNFAYTMELKQDEKIKLIRFDPRKSKEEQWTLVSINGEKPDEKAIAKFNKSHQDDEDETALVDMVKPGSLTLIEQSDAVARFSFVPVLDKLEDEADKMSGTLWYDKSAGYVSKLAVKNSEPLSPAFSVSLKHFIMEMEFARHASLPVVKTVHTRFDGTMGFFKSISQDTTQTYSGYELVTQQAKSKKVAL